MLSTSNNRLTISTSSFAYAIIALSITLRLVLGNRTLDLFYPYISDGGNPLLKIHPGTWLIIIGMAVYSLKRGTGKLTSDIFNKNRALAIALTATTIVTLYSMSMWGMGGGATLIDTYFFSILCLILANQLNNKQCISLFKYIAFLIAINCLIAIFEKIAETHLMPNPATAGFFRANALMDHPLNNALITLSVVLTYFISPLNKKLRYLFAALGFMALLAFAARAALIAYVSAIFFIILSHSFTNKMQNRKRLIRIAISPLSVAVIITSFYVLIFFTNYGDGISTRSTLDESGLSRFYALTFFINLPLDMYFFGVGTDGFYAFVGRYSRYDIIENFWVQLLLTFGVPMFILLFISYGHLIRKIFKHTSFQGLIVFTAWILTASTNNSLSVKTPALFTLLLTVYLLHRIASVQLEPTHFKNR